MTETLTCTYHPNREAPLRCNRCEQPICVDCAVLTPTGYRCKACVRALERRFDTARWYDYPLALGVAGGLSFLGSLIAWQLGFWMLFVAPLFGGLIAEAVRFVVRRRRSKWLFRTAAIGVVLGALPTSLPALLAALAMLSQADPVGFWPLIWQALYLFLVTPGVYYRLSGIMLTR